MGFSGGSYGTESAWNAGEPSSIPESGRSPGERMGMAMLPIQVVPGVKNLAANTGRHERCGFDQGWEDPLEK